MSFLPDGPMATDMIAIKRCCIVDVTRSYVNTRRVSDSDILT